MTDPSSPPAATALDHAHMAHALRLAERGLVTTRPNPRVGCVLAHGSEVVGEGWHRLAGGPHAEVEALAAAGSRARGATAYVTLEPCGLHGRTPPCADALIAAGVARVVIASEDAAQEAGGALERLRAAGIAVECGLLREAARELNRGFFSRIERGRPWLRLKLAMSLDGRVALADGASQWITGAAAREDVQRWRARSSAVLTGSGTVQADDPRLTLRLAEAGDTPIPPLLRVVLDRALRTPAGAAVLDGSAPTLVVHAVDAVPVDARFARVECVPVATTVETGLPRLDLPAVLSLLAARGVNELQVESGPVLGGALFAAGLVDELLLYVAPVLLGDRAQPLLALPTLADMASRWRLRTIDRRAIGADLRLLLRPD
ncbi:Riboflavin biosynthesis protein RibD [Dokdonella koreensis DS-123]|uniref:Riboflavin biosynthesis protein RibD n=2 Tax=Dokdonella TaxID=323413 RepID=A0A167GKR0_9GAMM|nr:Riboflavin biosynthesis protein RibD [Dokdonella koreensis DS-123]